MSATALFAHVPVDSFDIVRGPGAIACGSIPFQLAEHAERHPKSNEPFCVEFMVVLATSASAKTFRRTLRVANVFDFRDNEFHFTGIFSGQLIYGQYNMKTRKGKFTFD